MQNEINIELILDAVRQAGELFLSEFKLKPVPKDRETVTTLFTEIENRCLSLLENRLSAEFPDTPWCGEEFDMEEQMQPLDLPQYWLCDSMDGAIQYLQHLPGWTINLVLVREGRPHFAVIYDALQQETFWAQEGKGAYLNEKKITPGAKTELDLMLAVFNHAPGSREVPGLNQRTGILVTSMLDHLGAVRNYGPHGLQLAYLAAGRIDLFFQEGLDTYNWLPGILIAKEAGAEILTTDGRPWSWGEDSLMVASRGVGAEFLSSKSKSIQSHQPPTL